MRKPPKPGRLLLVLPALLLVVALAGGGYGTVTVRRSWPQVDGSARVDGLRAPVTVLRDSWGVPHIYASNAHDLFFTQGYVHAQDRFWQMEFWRRAGSGRLAEILGESALENDRFIRTIGWHRAAERELDMLDAETISVLESYADGVNAYISAHRGSLGLEFIVLGLTGAPFEPEPWTPLNTVTWGKVMAWDLSGNRSSELLRAHIAARLGTPAVDELVPAYPEQDPVIVPHPLTEASLRAVSDAVVGPLTLGTGEYLGSNSWVLAGDRTDTGAPLLANDPHLGIQMPSIWYEIGLHCEPVGPDCPYDVVGASFASSHGVIIGHNAQIAWGVTNLGPDVQDLFIERLNPEDPHQYEYRGEWRDVEVIREEIRVAGREEPVLMDVRQTHHGPIINDVGAGTEEDWSFGWQPLALSWTGLQPGTLMRSILVLNRAANWEEFREALSYWDTPSQNFVYADVAGNIGYQAPGRIPVRASGDGTTPVPGWTGEYEWVDTIPYDDLPRAFNPPEGYIVTANNAVVGDEYPYLLTRDWTPGYRAGRIIELIEAQSSLSIDDVQGIQADNVSHWARRVLPFVTSITTDQPELAEAVALLYDWDGRAVRESPGAALFELFRLHLIDATFGDELGEDLLGKARSSLMNALLTILPEPDSPWFDDVMTSRVETRDEILLRALEEAVQELSARQGSNMDNWRWGALHTASFENQSLGRCGIGLVEALFNRGPYPIDGSMATVNQASYKLDQPFSARTIASYRQIVDLGDLSRSVSMHTTGQSGHPFHRHYDDMIDPWRNVEYHPMLWDRTTVETQAEAVLILSP
ncbi:MAG: penicillin acylase family protein [Chloroflexota bacterium]